MFLHSYGLKIVNMSQYRPSLVLSYKQNKYKPLSQEQLPF